MHLLSANQTYRGRTPEGGEAGIASEVKLTRSFALTEALFGMVIVGVVFAALYSGMTYGFEMVRLSRENLRASQILQERFETIRLCNWDQINSNGFVSTNFSVPLYKGLSNDWYSGTVSIVTPS